MATELYGREAPRTAQLKALLGGETGVVVAAAVTFLMTGAEELWKRFLPRYLAVLALPLVMCWSSAAAPTIFAIIGDALPSHRRTAGFTVTSITRRIPIAIAPALGGLFIAHLGVRSGVRAGLAIAIGAAAVAFAVAARIPTALMPPYHAPSATATHGIWSSLQGVWGQMPLPLRRLLASDILVRTCESLVDVFVVLYATEVLGVSAPKFGLLVSIQMMSSMVVYFPAVALARRIGRKPLVVATFVAFALFPLFIIAAKGFAGLVLAFVMDGLRETGEPARKAVIVDLADPARRGRTTGLYYLVRSLSITPAALIGGALWSIEPELPFVASGIVGLIGALVFALTVPARDIRTS